MGGGGPAGFLNKKPWHPGRFQNQEEVWKREQKAAAEQKKLEELRQQYEDERKNQEIIQIAQDAGHGKKGDRLDWMYAGSLAAKEDAAKRQEEALLGQRAATLTGATQPMEISRVGPTPCLTILCPSRPEASHTWGPPGAAVPGQHDQGS
ncbi:hypothetical protein V8C86DRAFT_192422 [Haematococcus lacustris]